MLGRGCRDQVEVGSKTEGIHLEKEKEYLSDVEEKSKTIKVWRKSKNWDLEEGWHRYIIGILVFLI